MKQREFFTRTQLVLLAIDSKRIVKGIIRKTGLPPITVHRALKQLENLGLITSKKEKRMRFVTTTEKGKKARQLLIELWDLLTSPEDTVQPPRESQGEQ